MNAWLLFLGIAVGYLMQNKSKLSPSTLTEAEVAYNQAAEPETAGTTSNEIRMVQAAVPDGTTYQDMNLKNPLTHLQTLAAAQMAAAKAVSQYEGAGAPEVEGIYLSY